MKLSKCHYIRYYPQLFIMHVEESAHCLALLEVGLMIIISYHKARTCFNVHHHYPHHEHSLKFTTLRRV